MYKFNETSEGSGDFSVRRMHWRLSENNLLIKEQDFVYQWSAVSPPIQKKSLRICVREGSSPQSAHLWPAPL